MSNADSSLIDCFLNVCLLYRSKLFYTYFCCFFKLSFLNVAQFCSLLSFDKAKKIKADKPTKYSNRSLLGCVLSRTTLVLRIQSPIDGCWTRT